MELLQETRMTRSGPFISSDSEESYQKNLEQLGSSWFWANRSIYYQLNKQGYRCSEWDKIDWSSSILFFGCSQTFGVGLPLDMTIPYLVEQSLGISCINLARMGSSCMFQWANTVRLYSAGIRPRAVVYVWPDHCRVTHFLASPMVLSVGTWREGHELMPWVLDSNQGQEFFRHVVLTVNSLWTCPIIHTTFTEENLKVLNPAVCFRHEDSARDLKHPGPKSAQLLANYLVANLRPVINS